MLRTRLLFGYKDEREFRILAKSGEIRWVHHCSQPVWDKAEGRVVRIYGAVIGLDICQEIVRQHSGQIRAESSSQAGAAFAGCLPVEVVLG